MAQMTRIADATAVPHHRKSVRPSWSYETVAGQECHDSGEITERSILHSLRRRQKSRRLEEATDTEKAAQKLAHDANETGNALEMDMNAVPVSDTIQTEPALQQLRENDVRSRTENRLNGNDNTGEIQEVFLGENPSQPEDTLKGGPREQHALLFGGHLPGPKPGTPNDLLYETTWNSACSSMLKKLASQKVMEANSGQTASSPMDNIATIPYSPGPDHQLPVTSIHSLLSSDWVQPAKHSEEDLSKAGQETESDLCAFEIASAHASGSSLVRSNYDVRSVNQDVFKKRKLNPTNDLQQYQPTNTNELTAPWLDMAIIAKPPEVRIHTKALGLSQLRFSNLGPSAINSGEIHNPPARCWS